MGKAFYFRNEGERLFAILHNPRNSKVRKGIIFCHPYGEEKQLSYQVLVRFATMLCEKGFFVLRFDCRGYGDSDGDFEGATIETQVADTIKAIDFLKSKLGIEKVGLLGLRLGGTIAALVAERDSRVEKLILWSPVINGKEYLNELIRRKVFSELLNKGISASRGKIVEVLKSKGLIDIEAHYLTLEVYEQLLGIELTTQVSNMGGFVLITAIKDKPEIHGSFERLSEVYKRNGAVSEMKIVDEKPFWDVRYFLEWYFPEQLSRETLKWIT